MIINTGLRTDIPAFFSLWFLNRLKAGEVLVRNPYNPQSVTKYLLNPGVVDLLCFCTKNPEPLLTNEAQKLLSEYRQFWFVTITPYGKGIEPNDPDKQSVIESFKKLSGIVGPDNVSWRYDPVFIDEKYSVQQHKKSFEKICRELSGYTKECIFSFLDLYPKVKKNFPEAKEVRKEEQLELAAFFSEVCGRFGMKAKACCESPELSSMGADISGCMTKQVYQRAFGSPMDFPSTYTGRKECACLLSCDIGAYNTCAHFCRYCYANYSRETVLQNMKAHNPESPFIIGDFIPGDKIHEAEQKSWKSNQPLLEM